MSGSTGQRLLGFVVGLVVLLVSTAITIGLGLLWLLTRFALAHTGLGVGR
jgi:hypothetical protein